MNAPQLLLNKPAPGTQLDLSHPLNKGLVGCWLFNEQSGMQAYDLSPYCNHGTLHGFNDPSSKDRSSLGLQFDGNNDYVDCGNDPSLDITDAITIEAWVKLDEIDAIHRILGKWGGSNKKSYELNLISNKLTLSISQDGVIDDFKDGTTTLSANEWYHVVGVYDSPNIKVYLNGVLDGEKTTALTSLFVTTESVLVGVDTQYNNYFNGSIDEVRIYNRALNAKEIKKLYQEPYCMFERGDL